MAQFHGKTSLCDILRPTQFKEKLVFYDPDHMDFSLLKQNHTHTHTHTHTNQKHFAWQHRKKPAGLVLRLCQTKVFPVFLGVLPQQLISLVLKSLFTLATIGHMHVMSLLPCWYTVNKRFLISCFCYGTPTWPSHHCPLNLQGLIAYAP